MRISTEGIDMLDVHVAMLLIAACISPIVGLVTKWHAPSWVKSMLNLALTTLGVVIPTVVWTDGTPWQTYVTNILTAFAVSIAAHYGFYRPTSAAKAGWFQTPDTKTGNTGVVVPLLPHQRDHRVRHTHTNIPPKTHVAA